MDTNMVSEQKMTIELGLPLETIAVIDTGSYKNWKLIMT